MCVCVRAGARTCPPHLHGKAVFTKSPHTGTADAERRILLRPATAPLLPAIGHGWAWALGARLETSVDRILSLLYKNTTIGRTIGVGVGRVKVGLCWVLLFRLCYFSLYVFHPCDLHLPDWPAADSSNNASTAFTHSLQPVI